MLKEFDLVFTRESELAALGIDSDTELYAGRCYLDTKRVEAFWTCKDDFEGKETINVQMFSGELFTIIQSYNDFKELIK